MSTGKRTAERSSARATPRGIGHRVGGNTIGSQDFDHIMGGGGRNTTPTTLKATTRARGLYTSSMNHADEIEVSVGPEALEDASPSYARDRPLPSSSRRDGLARQAAPYSVARHRAARYSTTRIPSVHPDEVPMSDRPGVSASPNKKGKGKATDTNRKSGPNSERSQQPQKRKRVASQISSIDHGTHIGVRRSPRKRYEPLEWWRLEKAVYSLRAMGDANVPHIKEIIRLPKEPPQLLGAAGRRYRKRKPQLSASQVSDTEKATKSNLEEGWDDDTKSHGVVVDYITNEEVERHVISTFGMLDPKPAANEDFFFERVFADGGFMAAGYITIPPGRAKPNKNTKHNTYVFYVIEGAVNFVINQESFIIATGGEFLAPRGNTYYIQNISDRQAKLFFAQARKAPMGEDDEASRYAYNHRF